MIQQSPVDPVTVVDIISAASPILAALVAVSGVVATIVLTNHRERERSLQDRKTQLRLRDERISAYKKFLIATGGVPETEEDMQKIIEAYTEVELVISTDYLAILGQRVWEKQGSLRASWNRYSKDKTEENRQAVLDASSEAMDYREDFLDLVRKELEIK